MDTKIKKLETSKQNEQVLAELKEAKAERKQLLKGRNEHRRHNNLQRLFYVRYADDFLVGVIGSYTLAKTIKSKISMFLKDKLEIELSEDKTKITNPMIDPVFFLGYKIKSTNRRYASGRKDKNGKCLP